MASSIHALLLFMCVNSGIANEPRGHEQPFGAHTVPHDLETIHEFPAPKDFFDNFLLPGRPVVFKSILERVRFPPFRLWNDDYLREKFGHVTVEVENGKKEMRNGDLNIVNLREFLATYKKENIYMVQDLKTSMFEDMVIPRSIQCGGLQNFLETVVLWFSSGGTKSLLHYDMQDNFNCLLDGTKDLVLVDRKYQDLIEAHGFNDSGSYSFLDVDRVDMHKYPRIQEVPTFQVTLKAGDCMYIPYRWYHQVNSFGSRNLAVNIWVTHIPWFNDTDCENVNTDAQTVPFLDYGFVKPENIQLTHLLEELLEEVNVTKEDFLRVLVKKEADDLDDILKYVDKNGDSVITWEDILQIKAGDFIKRFDKSLKVSARFFEEVEEMSYNHGDTHDLGDPENSPHDEF